jgi:hypothetical protein
MCGVHDIGVVEDLVDVLFPPSTGFGVSPVRPRVVLTSGQLPFHGESGQLPFHGESDTSQRRCRQPER